MITQPHHMFGWLLLVLMIAVGVAAAVLSKPACRDRAKLAPFKMPALAVEFADSPARVAQIYDACEPRALSAGLDGDDRIYIPLYSALLPLVFVFIFLCMPGRVPAPARVALLAISVALVGAAAWSDSRENATLRRILDETTDAGGKPLPPGEFGAGVAQDLNELRGATTRKWTLLFVAFAVAGVMVVLRGGWWSVAVMLAYLLYAGLGLFSLYTRRYPLLEFTFTCLMGLPLVLTALWIACPPPRAPGDAAPLNQKFVAAQADR